MARDASAARSGLAGGLDSVLRVLDFSTLIGRPDEFLRGIEAVLYSLMGELAARSGVIAVGAGREAFEVKVARGRGGRALAGRRLALDGTRLAAGGTLAGEAARADDGDLGQLARELELELVVPLVHGGRLVGLLGLGASAHAAFGPAQRSLVERVGEIASALVANRELLDEFQDVNRRLSLKVHQLHTVFDVSRELNASLDEASILNVFTATVMGQVLVGLATLLVVDEGRIVPAVARGFEFSETELGAISALPAVEVLAARDRDSLPSTLGRALERAGLTQLVRLSVGSEPRALMALGRPLVGRSLSAEDSEFIETLGTQAIVACDNLRLHVAMRVKERMDRELGIARDIQRALLPAAPPVIPGYEIAASAVPCYEVGGDYYDFEPISAGLALAIGDVAGKSVPAALLMASVHASLRALLLSRTESPRELVPALNRLITRSVQPGRFVTFFYATLDVAAGALDYVNAGHNPPLVLRQDGSRQWLTHGGLVLGIFDDVEYKAGRVELQPGDLLVLYTDGVTEAMSPADAEFGTERLVAALEAARALEVSALLRHVLAALETWEAGEPSRDDTTLVLMRRVA